MMRATEKARGIHFEVRRLKGGLRVSPRDKASIAMIEALSFKNGSSLFRAVLARLRKRVDPDQTDWPPLPDPFGFLTGKQTIPWKLLNPAAKRCMVCTPQGDGGVVCVEVACDPNVS